MVFCQKCGCDREVDVEEQGITVCMTCGQVFEEFVFSADVQFQKDAAGESAVMGQFVSESGVARGIGRIHGGRVYAYQADSHERAQHRGRHDIAHLVDQLSISKRDLVIESSHRIYKLALQRGFTRGRRTNQVAAACVYLICRQENEPFLLIDFSDALQVNVFTLGAVFLQLAKLLRLEEHPLFSKPVDPSLYIKRFVERMDLPDQQLRRKVSETAVKLVASMKRDWIQTGRRPSGVCGAALFIAAHLHGVRRSKREVVNIVHIGEHTLAKRLTEFAHTDAAALTREQFTHRDQALKARETASLTDAPSQAVPQDQLGKLTGCEHLALGVQHFRNGMCRECYKSFVEKTGGMYDGSNPPAFTKNRSLETRQAATTLLMLPAPGEKSDGDEEDAGDAAAGGGGRHGRRGAIDAGKGKQTPKVLLLEAPKSRTKRGRGGSDADAMTNTGSAETGANKRQKSISMMTTDGVVAGKRQRGDKASSPTTSAADRRRARRRKGGLDALVDEALGSGSASDEERAGGREDQAEAAVAVGEKGGAHEGSVQDVEAEQDEMEMPTIAIGKGGEVTADAIAAAERQVEAFEEAIAAAEKRGAKRRTMSISQVLAYSEAKALEQAAAAAGESELAAVGMASAMLPEGDAAGCSNTLASALAGASAARDGRNDQQPPPAAEQRTEVGREDAEARQEEEEEEDDGRLSEIEDADIEMYIADADEVKYKEEIWNLMNQDWIEKQEAKRAALEAAERLQAEQQAAMDAAEAAGIQYKRGRGRPLGSKTKPKPDVNMPPADTPQEAAMRMLDHKKLSSKINYSVLADLFSDPDLSVVGAPAGVQDGVGGSGGTGLPVSFEAGTASREGNDAAIGGHPLGRSHSRPESRHAQRLRRQGVDGDTLTPQPQTEQDVQQQPQRGGAETTAVIPEPSTKPSSSSHVLDPSALPHTAPGMDAGAPFSQGTQQEGERGGGEEGLPPRGGLPPSHNMHNAPRRLPSLDGLTGGVSAHALPLASVGGVRKGSVPSRIAGMGPRLGGGGGIGKKRLGGLNERPFARPTGGARGAGRGGAPPSS